MQHSRTAGIPADQLLFYLIPRELERQGKPVLKHVVDQKQYADHGLNTAVSSFNQIRIEAEVFSRVREQPSPTMA